MGIKKSHEQYVLELEGTNFSALEEYKGCKTKSLHRCNICGLEWLVRPNQLRRQGCRCPSCDLKARTLSDSKVAEVLLTNGLIKSSEYLGALKPLSVKSTLCGHSWTTTYAILQQGSGCPICSRGFGYLNKDSIPSSAILYVLNFDNQFMKIGITTRSLSRRIRELKSRSKICSIEPLYTITSTGYNILELERILLNGSIKFSYKDKFEGSTELVSIDSINFLSSTIESLSYEYIVSKY